MQHITLVKKILADGRICVRCCEVLDQLRHDDLLHRINHQVLVDDNDADSIGSRLAQQFEVKQVPFFLVDDALGETHVFQDYQTFKLFIQ